MFDPVKFGDAIVSVMTDCGLSYRAASLELGLPHYTLHRVATARHLPDVETFLRIVQWMRRQRKPKRPPEREDFLGLAE